MEKSYKTERAEKDLLTGLTAVLTNEYKSTTERLSSNKTFAIVSNNLR